METITGISNFTPSRDGCVLTVGVYDGVHRGHREVIRKAVEMAETAGREMVLLTFAPGPTEFFTGTDEGFYLLTLEEFISELVPIGVDRLLLMPFDIQLRGLGADEFLIGFVRGRLDARALVVGTDFSFGQGKEGTIDLIISLGGKLGLELITVDEVVVDGIPVRSTILREMIREGRIEEANNLLGYEFYLIGRVSRGQGVGKSLNSRTANFEWPKSKVKPKRGVYIVRVLLDGVEHPAVANFGVRPTITGGEVEDRLEAHLIDFEGVLEGKEIVVRFVRFVREEKKFPSKEELAKQIAKDISYAREFFTAHEA